MVTAIPDINLTDKLRTVRDYFKTGETKDYLFRKRQLQNLKRSVLEHEDQLYEALYSDLKKNKEETWVTETGLLITEINVALKNLRSWMKPERAKTNLLNLPSSSFVLREPLGVVLIIGPWNYPLQLLLIPLVGAIAAGNCIVLKPSEFAPATAAVMKGIIENAFPKEYVLYVEGEGQIVVPEMMNHFVFDHVFYTGSTAIGKIIYKMAAEKLVPVTLELGGKSPCVVENDANIAVAAKRIAVTKFSNAGQMCVAPDYLLVHKDVEARFLEALTSAIRKFFSDDAANNYHFGRIINQKQFDRLVKYLHEGEIIFGGKYDRDQLFIEPTILQHVADGSSMMREEIFGPVLPVITYTTHEQAKAIIEQNPDPLAFYVYTSSEQKEKYWMENVAFGGGCVNNSSWHFTNHYLPFGGRGLSGMGKYHGRYSFETFSHAKAIMKTPTWFDPALRYPPFKGKLGLFKKLIR